MEEIITAQKKALRREYLAARSALGTGGRPAASAQICEFLARLPELEHPGIILSYCPMMEETDVSAFHIEAARRGIDIAYPVTGKGGMMEAYIPHEPSAMKADRYGILAPVPENSEYISPERLCAVLVPCVAFTMDGMRLGHGGGYYDRYLLRCPQAVRVLPAFSAQCAPELPADQYDLPIHIIVTEHGITRLTGG